MAKDNEERKLHPFSAGIFGTVGGNAGNLLKDIEEKVDLPKDEF